MFTAITRMSVAAYLVVAAGLPSLARAEPSLTEQLATIAKENEATEKKFREELIAANHDNGKVSQANRDRNDAVRDQAQRLKAVMKAHPDEPAVLTGAILMVGKLRYYLDDEQTKIVLNHITDPKVGELCFVVRSRAGENWARQILRAAAEKNPSEAIRGQAVFSLGDNYRSEAFPYGRELPEEQRNSLLKSASGYYERTMAEYADVRTPDGKMTLGEKARHELARIRNLPELNVGGNAPPIVGKDLQGNELRLEDYRGKVVVVVFWGRWCGPCMAMVPHEREIYERYRNKPFALLGVNCGDTLETANATVKEMEMAWPSWWDGEQIRGPIETEYNVPHWPSVYVIDAKGTFVAIDVRGEDLDAAIEKALGNKE
jgi:thiol-disulfide isomerase/thioredoxin